MTRKIPYRFQLNFLLIGSLVFAIAVYQLNIRSTVSLYLECKNLELKKKEAQTAPIKMKQMKTRLLKLESLIQNGKEKISPRDQLLEIVTAYAQKNQLVLKEIPKINQIKEKELEVELDRFEIQGNFVSLLKLIHQLEQKEKVGKIASVEFNLKNNNVTKQANLTSLIYIQNIKKSIDEPNQNH